MAVIWGFYLTNHIFMKTFFLVIIILLSGDAFGQKTKTVDIARTNTITIYGTLYYNSDNNPADTSYFIIGQDGRYQQLISYVTIYKGGLIDLYELLKYSLKFYNEEEDGVSETRNGHHLSITKTMGIKTLFISEINGNGYTAFSGVTLKKLISRLEEWARASKIPLKN